jgi:hypothetical protein
MILSTAKIFNGLISALRYSVVQGGQDQTFLRTVINIRSSWCNIWKLYILHKQNVYGLIYACSLWGTNWTFKFYLAWFQASKDSNIQFESTPVLCSCLRHRILPYKTWCNITYAHAGTGHFFVCALLLLGFLQMMICKSNCRGKQPRSGLQTLFLLYSMHAIRACSPEKKYIR